MTRLEQTILKNLVYNEDFTRKVLPFIQSEYFSDSIERKVFAEIKEFVNRYEQVPTHEALVINFTEKKELTEDEVSKSIELLNEIKTTSNEKVDQVCDALDANEGAYFVPVLDTIPQDVIAKYPNSTIYGVRDILNMIGNPFTPEEYFTELRSIKEELIQDIKDGN